MWHNLSDREKKLIIFGLIAVICMVYWFYGEQPTTRTIDELESDLQQLRRELMIARVQSKKVKVLKKKYDKLLKQKEELPYYFYLDPEEFYETIEEMGKQANVEIKIYTVQSGQEDERGVNLGVDGNYEDILNFLSGMRYLKNIVDYNSLNITSDGELNLIINLNYNPETPGGEKQ
ncbi:type II secretion system protein GspM [Halothermothrix orenii]|uniref:Uncharacterized protein n=1 Tax=Halothermothrix orenii (strain H 168 / OCM 544 / DSM 9562) TaxID=373903 RepID=B8D2D7_HALOH|nr:type II secretion system protein GspM [Halothermothrix orenii]ACL69364.1 hypothetical protein Hore_06070 [Halothermothrix orenii H 168]